MEIQITINDKIVTHAESFEIKTQADMPIAVEMLSEINSELDRITKDKKKLTDPLNAALDEINSRYKPHETRLKSSKEVLRSLISQYQTNATKMAQEEAERIAARVGEGKGKLKFETAERQVANIDTPDLKVSTDAGSISFRTDTKFKLMDITMVPAEYLLLDETKVRAALKTNIRVPGLEYYEVQTPINKRS